MHFVNLLIDLLPSLAIAVITALVTVRLSLKRFYSERWWERKADTYSRIVESLHQMKAYCEDQMEYIEMGQELENDKENELRLKFKKSSDEIRRAIDIGSFFISLESQKIVQRLKDDIEKATQEPSFYEYLNSKLKCVNTSLNHIQTQAKKDLGVK